MRESERTHQRRSKVYQHMTSRSWMFCTCCFHGQTYTIEFLRFCKQATLQFCVIKPLMSILTIILQAIGVYKHGVFSVTNSYLYVTVIYNASAFVALYALFMFFLATRDILQPFDPVIKFAAVKSVVFLCFWQGVILAILEKFGVIPSLPNTDSGTVAAGIQNFLICCEMLVAAIVFRFAFPSQLYSDGVSSADPSAYDSLGGRMFGGNGTGDQGKLLSSSSGSLRSLKDTVNPKDMFHDAIHNFHPSYQKYTQQLNYSPSYIFHIHLKRTPKDELDDNNHERRNSPPTPDAPSNSKSNLHKPDNHIASQSSYVPAPPIPPTPR